MSLFAKKVKGKKVLVFGLGLQGGGLGDALWLFEQGASVRITDKKTADELRDSLNKLPSGITLSLGGHLDSDVTWADLIIKNPGVPDNLSQLVLARKLHKPVYTSIALTVLEGRDKVIAVTGTRGKSTTTKLIYELLNSVYPGEVELGGNVPGTSGLSILDRLDQLMYLVLELSSFQLHNFHELKISPHIAVITNMYPDHLNRYLNMEEYFVDKSSITMYQKEEDYVVYNQSNEYAHKLAGKSNAQKIPYFGRDVPSDWSINIPGLHNLENISAVIRVANILNIDINQVKKIVDNFHGLPFRLEKRRTVNGVTYINDTTSTTPTSTIKAIEAMDTPTIIIVGGDDKNLPFVSMIEALKSSSVLKKIIILGSLNIPKFTSELESVLKEKIIGKVSSMEEAVQLASNEAQEGWTVLLSPGFSSFDLFKNEFDRGLKFNECVEKL